MEQNDLEKRFDDLQARAERRGVVTCTGFLTPTEQHALRQRYGGPSPVLTGGGPGCERQAAFFLPDWMDPADFDPAEHIRAVRVVAHFGAPGHRDYLGAALGLGIRREWLGDIRVDGGTAHIFCLPSVERLLLDELTKVGRCGVTVTPCALSDVPVPERKVKTLSFTVKSPRLDAAAASMFGLSRTAAAELIRLGAATLNYEPCEKPDAAVKAGDVISLRGRGKGEIKSIGGRSKKDRLFVEAEVYI